MSEYIEREAAVAKITELINQSGKYTDYECGADDACYIVNHIPPADVRPVVLCRDCMLRKFCKEAQYRGEDGFCSYGEKREES